LGGPGLGEEDVVDVVGAIFGRKGSYTEGTEKRGRLTQEDAAGFHAEKNQERFLNYAGRHVRRSEREGKGVGLLRSK
jgi:hypothetical protein